MPSTFTQNYYHAVFSTRNRASLITPNIESALYPFVGGIVRDLGCSLLAINGMPDHVHLLIRYRADLSHSDMIRHIKGRSSKWINEQSKSIGRFGWQEGYGGFTVSASAVAKVKTYIENQKERHKKWDFKTEFLELLRRHGVDFDPDDVFK